MELFQFSLEWTTNRLLTMGNSEMSITKKMLAKIREGKDKQAADDESQFIIEEKENDNFLTRSKTLMEEAVDASKKKVNEEDEKSENVDSSHKNYVSITKNTPQFGDVRTSQEETIKKTISTNIIFGENALRYFPDSDDMTLDGNIPSLNLKFQFRYNDPSGNGSYLWCDALQLTDENVKAIGKLKSAFENWKDGITQDGDLMERLNKTSKQN